MYVYVPGNHRARASGAVGSHGRQDPVPDPRVFGGGRGLFFTRFSFFSLFQIKYVYRLNCSDPRRPKARDVLPSVRTAVRRVSYLVLKIPKFLSCLGWGPLEPPPLQRTKSGRGSATEPMAARPRRILRPSIEGGVAEGTNPKGWSSQLYVNLCGGPLRNQGGRFSPNVRLEPKCSTKGGHPLPGNPPSPFSKF